MKQTFAIWFLIALPIMVCGQVNEKLKLIDMAKAYKSYMFMSEPPKTVTDQLVENLPANLSTTCNFIIQTITTKNNLLTPKY
ncbi:MAG: hypothetical protein MUC81_14215, partial [Bacteroidia bacterium]|nr:hypothetical protein [Bacteroidia bacterium]